VLICRVNDDNFNKVITKLGAIWRRYTDFELLRSYLENAFPFIVMPPLPEKKVRLLLCKEGVTFINKFGVIEWISQSKWFMVLVLQLLPKLLLY